MLSSQPNLTLTDAEFRLFTDLLRSRCGLHFDQGTRFLVEKRLARRIEESDAGSFASYLYTLRHGPKSEEEFSKLVDILTTNETYFFRERSQLTALVQEIIPNILSKRPEGRPVSIWSAGCSSGEEPFSIVMMALEANLVLGRDVRVYASDISRAVLTKARRGIYREASFRDTDPSMRLRYFAQKEGLTRISDEVKRHVDFVHMNLLDIIGPQLLYTM